MLDGASALWFVAGVLIANSEMKVNAAAGRNALKSERP